MSAHPNFPQGLDITPLIFGADEKASFNAESQRSAIRRFGIAGRIWEAAELITRYFYLSGLPDWHLDPPCSIIRGNDDELEDAPAIVELGAGTGYVGLCLAEQLLRLGKRKNLIVLTDLPDVCSLLEETLHHEKHRWMTLSEHSADAISVKILPLPWGGAVGANQLSSLLCDERNRSGKPRHLTHVVCSELVYFPHLLAPLLRTLLQLTSHPFALPDRPVEVIISYKIRSLSKETAFWSTFGLWFSFSPVLARHEAARASQECSIRTEQELPEAQNWHVLGSESFVFIGYRRAESFEWTVPENDDDLLAGIGAQGSDLPKGDDTFETLLLMQVSI